MAQFLATIDLSSLDGTTGFRLTGEVAGDRTAWSVASAGDVNGDGFADVIVGAHGANSHGAESGASYVVFGKTSGFAANLDLSSLNGVNGFKLSGVAAGDRSGWPVASAGDVNGDGFDDLIVGARYADPQGPDSGASHVVFGKASGFAANLDLSSLDGINGFTLDGLEPGDQSGASVASAGDVNGDGFADLIVGAPSYWHSSHAGKSYVVFGKATGFSARFDLASLDGTNGFRLTGVAAPSGQLGDRSGMAVASAGDINGDGFADLIVGAPYAKPQGTEAGASYVVFGKASGFAANLDLAGLNGANGFRLSGVEEYDRTGWSVASAGDVNGDGFDDLVVGAWGSDGTVDDARNAYVVFGKASGFTANFDLWRINGGNGFRIASLDRRGSLGWSVASAGDVNGDGFDDVITAEGATGAGYVVFGKASGFGSVVPVTGLTGDNGFSLTGASSGGVFSVGSAGDVNHDGFADMILGDGFGTAYVVFGHAPHAPLILVGTEGPDTLTGAGADDNLSGHGGDDTLSGLDGNDTLDGGTGADAMSGGAGNDTYVLDNVGDAVTENPAAGIDTVRTTLSSHTLAANVETLVFIGSGNFSGGGNELANGLTGLDGNDTLTGLGGSDLLDGGAGADTMAGGIGDNSYVVDNAGDVVTENAGEGTDTVRTGLASYTVGAHVENLAFTGSGEFAGTGNALANHLTGGNGNDTLDGKAGADTMVGGTGNDTYFLDEAADRAIELAGGGRDLVNSSIALTLPSEIEVLILTGTLGLSGTGNGSDNVLTGNTGNNILSGLAGDDMLFGGGGNDRLDGGTGNDTLQGGAGNNSLNGGGGTVDLVSYAGATAGIVVTNMISAVGDASAGTDVLAGFEVFEGSSFDDTVTASILADTLYGGIGNDRLTGRTGDDTLFGGADSDVLLGSIGNDSMFGGVADDTFFVGDAGDVVFEQAGGGLRDVVNSAIDVTLWAEVEALVLIGTLAVTATGNGLDNKLTGNTGNNTLSGRDGNDTLFGGAGDDRLIGGDGNDRLYGGAGNDSLAGGLGDDLYWLDSPDQIVEGAASGIDTVLVGAGASGVTLGGNVEIAAVWGSGARTITGGGSDNTLSGGSADDNLSGGLGNNSLLGGAGHDTLDGGDGNDSLSGGAGNDTLTGGLGDDILAGGAGRNTASAGDGLDTFVFDQPLVAATLTTVVDFTAGADRISLALSIFTAAGLAGPLDGAAFHTGTAAHDADDRIVYNSLTGALIYDSNGSGSGGSRQFALLSSGLALTADDFLVT